MSNVLRTEWETPESCPKCGEHLALEWAFCPMCGRATDWSEEQNRCMLYTKEWSDGRKEYRYGPDWVAMQLYMEGGYPTPEEAKLAWLREWE